jgi:hypothetical protein
MITAITPSLNASSRPLPMSLPQASSLAMSSSLISKFE